MPPYNSPKDLRGRSLDFIPEGDFILPICTNRERFFLMLQALQYFKSRTADHQNLDQLIDTLEAWAYIGNPQDSPCFPALDTTHEENECVDYPTDAPIISYAPQNPFTQVGYIPPGYIAVPFLAVHEGDPLNLLGFQVGDVLTGYLSAPILTPALGEGLARIRVRFEGTGVVELHLIKIPAGGMAVITHDDNPFTAQTVVLNKDLVALPPETNGIIIIEIPFETPGAHHIDISFIARFNDEITFLSYGGGLRSVVLCGFDKTLDKAVEERGRKGAISVEESNRMAVRVDPDRCYMLQFECMPGEWQDLLDTRCGALVALPQPTNGDALNPGECREWDVVLDANQKWLLPIPVSAGYTLQITGASGAWSDGSINWWCINGQTFVLGACTELGAATDEDDPLPTERHMRLIMSVDGVFYDAYNATFAVPGGVEDGQVFFQANDETINDNSGKVSFHVKACRATEVIAPITLDYDYGTGVTELDQSAGQTSWIVGITATPQAGAGYSVRVNFSENVKITVQSAPGWESHVGESTPYSSIDDDGSPVELLYWSADPLPTGMPAATEGDKYNLVTGDTEGNHVFTVQLLIEKV